MSAQPHKPFTQSRGLWLLLVGTDGAELQNLETGLCLEVRPDTESGDDSFVLCRFAPAPFDGEEDAPGEIYGYDVAPRLSREGAFHLIQQLAERVGALDLKDFQESA